MSDRLLKESDVMRAIDKRVEELRIDPEFVRKKGYIDVLGIKKYILTIPSTDRPQGWIPCSERLPEETGTYMTTIDYGKHGIATGQRYYYGQNLGWDDDCVIAWMPLPDPWEGADYD